MAAVINADFLLYSTITLIICFTEVESSRTHFEVNGLGLEGQVLGLCLEASSPRKLPCPRLEDSTFFELLKSCRSPKIWRLFFWRTLALVSLVLGLGLELSCFWPREGLSSKELFLASDFFCGLGLEPCVLDSTSAVLIHAATTLVDD